MIPLSESFGFFVLFCFVLFLLHLLFAFGDLVFDVRMKLVMHFNQRAEMGLINLKTFFLQIRGSGNAGRNIRLDVLNLHEQ